jgi:hypothetical protein
MKTIQGMSFAYKVICLVVVFGKQDETECIEYVKNHGEGMFDCFHELSYVKES